MEHAQLPSTSSTAPTVEATTSRSALPSYIPQERYAGKMLIVCFDGTGNEFNTDNSNIVQLVSMLKRDDKTKQMVYYQPEIGTYLSHSSGGRLTPIMAKISKTRRVSERRITPDC